VHALLLILSNDDVLKSSSRLKKENSVSVAYCSNISISVVYLGDPQGLLTSFTTVASAGATVILDPSGIESLSSCDPDRRRNGL
jgi:hypothetical protein